MDDAKNGYQATPNATLEQQMMDACAPKNEREWWAFAEIGRLRAEVARLRADQTIPPNERQPIVVQQRDAAWAESASRLTEIERLRAELDSIRQYGSDTLSGRTDGPDDRRWQRDAVLEMTNRASRALRGE